MSDTSVLYLRGMPRALVREAKALAARRGVTLTHLIAFALESVLGEGPTSDALSPEIVWYEKHRGQLVKRHRGEYVAITGGEVIDHDRDFEALAERVYARVGAKPVFMPKVSAQHRVLKLRSPRVTRS